MDHSTNTLRPSLIVIGAQKGGTTALFKYLSCHPQLCPPAAKEIDFFNCNTKFRRGTAFYHAYFPEKSAENAGKQSFDVTPGYFGTPEAAERIHKYDPGMNLVLLLRDPVRRAFSAWQMYRKFHEQNPDWFFKWVETCDVTLPRSFFVARSRNFGKSFGEDMEDEKAAIKKGRTIEMPILILGRYFALLSQYLKFFPREQILVVSTERMYENTPGTLRKIEHFAGLEPHAWGQHEVRPHFEGDYERAFSPVAAGMLADFYQSQNEALRKIVDVDLPWLKKKVAGLAHETVAVLISLDIFDLIDFVPLFS